LETFCGLNLDKLQLSGFGVGVSKVSKVKADIHVALHGNPISELRDVTCHMGSHSVTCHPTQVNAPPPNPSHAGWYSVYLSRRDGRLS